MIGSLTLLAASLMAPVTAPAQKAPPSVLPGAGQESAIYYIDRMDPVRGYKTESMFGTFDTPPSRILAQRGPFGFEGDKKGYGKNGLKIICNLEPAPENPTENPGSAAYYTTLKKGGAYFDASRFHYLSFLVRGEIGGEKLQVGLVDKQREETGKCAESGSIEAYTERGAIDKEWQRAQVPLDIFGINAAEVYQVLILFDNRLYDSVKGRSLTVFLDNLALE